MAISNLSSRYSLMKPEIRLSTTSMARLKASSRLLEVMIVAQLMVSPGRGIATAYTFNHAWE